jgi:hypothetical protein
VAQNGNRNGREGDPGRVGRSRRGRSYRARRTYSADLLDPNFLDPNFLEPLIFDAHFCRRLMSEQVRLTRGLS